MHGQPPGRGREGAYLGLLALGVAVPYAQAVPWLAEHGPDAPRFVRATFATRISSFFAWDVVVSAGTLLALAAVDDELPVRQRALVAAGSLGGSSVGLPLYLWLRERQRRTG
jgi:Terpene cyclase DEP1